jgi:tubulin polyglutamylase TTLL6/13
MDNLCMHLTNYAINKDNPNFEFNDDVNRMDIGHKRSLTSVLQLLRDKNLNIDETWQEVKSVIIKTICSSQPILSHHYKSCQPDNYSNNMCFELLGFDIILDEKLKPYVLEVNHTPSFSTDTPLDTLIKKNAIRDSLQLMNINVKTKAEIMNQRKNALQQRVLTGKKVKLTPEEKQITISKCQKE